MSSRACLPQVQRKEYGGTLIYLDFSDLCPSKRLTAGLLKENDGTLTYPGFSLSLFT
jgi:hypothetical protein